jgi:hypothetical protein
VSCRLRRFAQNVGENELDGLAKGDQAQTILAWKDFDEVVLGV